MPFSGGGAGVAGGVVGQERVGSESRTVPSPGSSAVVPAVPEAGFVTMTFAAGFGPAWDSVPADLAQAVLMLAARYYEDRGFDSGQQLALPHGVGALIERWRAVRTLAGRGGRA